MKLKVAEGWQVKYDGKVRHGGETFDASDTSEVQAWLSAGWVSEVKESKTTDKK